VFLLSIDEDTLRHRLLTRTAHDFGTKPHELELLLAWNEAIDQHYRSRGAIVIDATKPPPFVVDEILNASGRANIIPADRVVRTTAPDRAIRARAAASKTGGVWAIRVRPSTG
jgi:hypothetical protein